MLRGLGRAVVLASMVAPGVAGKAQMPGGATPDEGQQAVRHVIQTQVLNAGAVVPKTGQPLPRDGAWSAGPGPAEVCGEETARCRRVLYRVPQVDVVCEWTVRLGEGGGGGQVLAENDEAARYLLWRVPPERAGEMVLTRKLPGNSPIAQAAHVTGEVVVRAEIGPDGKLMGLYLVSGPEMLRGAALAAAREWTFKPMTFGTRNVSYQMDLSFVFAANGARAGEAVTAGPPRLLRGGDAAEGVELVVGTAAGGAGPARTALSCGRVRPRAREEAAAGWADRLQQVRPDGHGGKDAEGHKGGEKILRHGRRLLEVTWVRWRILCPVSSLLGEAGGAEKRGQPSGNFAGVVSVMAGGM